MVPGKNEKGFSLIEVMIVLVIIAIAAAAAGVQMKNRATNKRVKNAAVDMYASFQRAKMEAVKKRADVIFTLTPAVRPALDSYSLFIDDGGTTGTAGNGVQDGDEQVLVNAPLYAKPNPLPHSIPPDVNMTITFTNNQPGFNSQGLPFMNRYGSVVFHNNNDKNGNGDLTDDDARWYRVTLSVAGFVKMEMSTDGNVWQ